MQPDLKLQQSTVCGFISADNLQILSPAPPPLTPTHDPTPSFLLNLQYCVSDCLWKGPSFLKLRISQTAFTSSILLHGVIQLASLAISSGPIPLSSFLLRCSRLGPHHVSPVPLSQSPTWPPFLYLPLDNLAVTRFFFVNNNGDITNPLQISRDISVQTKSSFFH